MSSMVHDLDWSQVLLRVTAIMGLLFVLGAAQIAVLYAYLYVLVTSPAEGTHPVAYPPLWFVALMTGGATIVLWRAHRGMWGDYAAGLTVAGCGLLGVATLSMTAVAETGGGAIGGSFFPTLEFGWMWYSQGYSAPNIGSPAIQAVKTTGREASASLGILPLVIGYPALAAGLWLHRWLDGPLAKAVTVVNMRFHARE